MQMRKFVISTVMSAALLLCSSSTEGQSVNSSVQGLATDATGAAVPDADVTLTNTRTGVALKGKTDHAGTYSFPSVPLGLYNLNVSKAGFASYQINQFNVIVGQRATENATLQVASTEQTVTVNAGSLADLLQPESNDLGTVIGPKLFRRYRLTDVIFCNSAFSRGRHS